MSITSQQIDEWLNSSSEDQHLEFKEAKTQLDTGELCKYCVAIANEDGGHLVLGVSDKKPRKVVGTQAFRDPKKAESRIYEGTGLRVDVAELPHPDGRIVVFEIPPRPQSTAYQYKGAYWMRTGSEVRPMSSDRLRKIHAEGKPDWLERPAMKGVNAPDVLRLLDMRSFFNLLNLPYPNDSAEAIEKLVSESLITGQDDTFDISNLAAVTLANNLRDFKSVAYKAPRVIVYQGNDKTQPAVRDTTGNKGYAVGFKNLVRHVMHHLPQHEVIENALRREIKMLPEISIRELAANALIHQDFEQSGMSPMIEIYPNRVEISNPGEPIVPVERFIDRYRSRNEKLVDIMRRFSICEARSSGIDKAIQEIEACQLPAPEFQASLDRTIVTAFGQRPFGDMDRGERIRACYQHCALQYVQQKKMTNQSLRQRFGLPEKSANKISQVLAYTMDNGLIKLDSNAPKSKKYARYLPQWA